MCVCACVHASARTRVYGECVHLCACVLCMWFVCMRAMLCMLTKCASACVHAYIHMCVLQGVHQA